MNSFSSFHPSWLNSSVVPPSSRGLREKVVRVSSDALAGDELDLTALDPAVEEGERLALAVAERMPAFP
jgi:hypothetical protein